MKQALADLYSKYFVEPPILDEEVLQFSTPFLLDPSEQYLTAKKKVMIVGQETFEWYGKYANFLSQDDPVTFAQNIYTNFVKSESQNYNSPFWDYLNRMFSDSDVGWIWNNVFKMETVEFLRDPKYLDKKVSLSQLSKNKKYRYLINKIKLHQQDVFLKELEILKPDMIIFFTGNPYDSLFIDWQFDTKENFFQDIPEAVEHGIDKWKLGRFNSPLLPKNTFRTYHPNYLRRASSKVLSQEQKDFIFSFLHEQVKQKW